MDDTRTLAFVGRQETVDRLPPGARIVPMRPTLVIPTDRLLAPRPEALLDAEDCAVIDDRALRFASEWPLLPLTAEAFTWKGVNLAGCFGYELKIVARDVFKTAHVLANALEGFPAARIVTDTFPEELPFPPYPYMHAIGSLSEALAKAAGIPFQALAPNAYARRAHSRGRVSRVYGRVAARRAMSVLDRASSRLIIAIGPHPEFYVPLAASWQRTGGAMIVVTPASAPIRADAQRGLHLLPAEAFLGPDDGPEIRRYVGRAQASLERPDASRPEIGMVGVSGTLHRHLLARIRQELPVLAALGLGFERGLDRPEHVVLVETGSPLAKATVRYARARGRSLTVLQHGVLAGVFGYAETEADRVAAWGSTDAEWFRAHLGPDVRVAPTGCPRYDAMVGARAEARSSRPQRSGRAAVVLFASQPFVQDRASRSPWDRSGILEAVLTCVGRIPGCRLVVKWHPSEPTQDLPNRELDAEARKLHRSRTIPLLRRADVVLAISSTVAVEAMLLDRPVLFLGPQDPDSPFHPPEDGGGLRAADLTALEAGLRSVLHDPAFRDRLILQQREFLARRYAPADGRAAERVVTLLQES